MLFRITLFFILNLPFYALSNTRHLSKLARAMEFEGGSERRTTVKAHHPESFVQSLKQKTHSGEKVYKEFCALCHDPDPEIQLGAPRINTPSDWKHRTKNLNALLKTVCEGTTNMPPRGGCFECPDELLEAAINYLLTGKDV